MQIEDILGWAGWTQTYDLDDLADVYPAKYIGDNVPAFIKIFLIKMR